MMLLRSSVKFETTGFCVVAHTALCKHFETSFLYILLPSVLEQQFSSFSNFFRYRLLFHRFPFLSLYLTMFRGTSFGFGSKSKPKTLPTQS